jgi:hypothetical protein
VDDDGGRSDRPAWSVRLLAVAAALLVVGPGLGPGFVLVNDMVFVPRQYPTADALGLGSAPPRAVPADAVLAALTAVVPGDLVQKAVLLAVVVAAVTGAARLVRPLAGGRTGPAAVAGLVYGWSPFLAERLLMGHWSLLLGYAALPWVARAALALRAGRRGALPRLVLAMAPAALVVTGGLLAAGLAVALGGRRRLGRTAGCALVLALPWLVAGALHPAAGLGDPAGVAAFAARAENWSGVGGALLGGGGIWNAAAVPGSRASVVAPLVTALLVALAAYGWARVASGWGRAPAVALAVLGGVGLLLAGAGVVPGLREALAVVVADVPGGGVLRDGQKWAAWWVLALAVGAGAGAARLAERGSAGRVVVVAALLLPVAALPDLAWGAGGRLQPVAFPDDWARVRDVLATDPHPGAVLALPFGAVRSFGWNAGRPQLDPAPRFLPRPVVVDDELVVGRSGEPALRVAGEDPRARAVGAARDDPAALGALGVGWVLVEHGTPGPPPGPAVAALPQVVAGHWLTLLRVPGVAAEPGPAVGAVLAVLGADALALAAVLAAAAAVVAGGPPGSPLSTARGRVTVCGRRAPGRRESG